MNRSRLLRPAAVLPALALLTATLLGLRAAAEEPAGRAMTPAGFPVNRALYLTMRDGVKIAVDVWLPADLAAGKRVPTVLRATRYWRAAAGSKTPRHSWLCDAGFALVQVDARGSGASFGTRPVEWSDDEVADYGEVIDWIARQPWSNGRVGAYGVSYEGNTAELAAAACRPALRATSPQYGNFDPQLSVAVPGGVFNDRFIGEWNRGNQHLDTVPGLAGAADLAKVPHPKPVDDDPAGLLLRQAVAGHRSLDVHAAIAAVTYADDRMGPYTIRHISPAVGRRAAIEKSMAPMYVWVGWMDAATADGALCRYLTFKNPQRVVIGAFSHGGFFDTDPFLPADAPTNPSPTRQHEMIARFFADHLVADRPAERGISYYTNGEGEWHTTTTWPPAGLTPRTWYLGGSRQLVEQRPAAGTDTYRVDFTATTTTTGTNRWFTPLDGRDVVYPDRRQEDEKLLTYTSDPLPADLEITGTPVVSIILSSTERDGALFAYLEDVAPDGRVTYLTEGMLRLIHRKVSTRKPPYAQLGPYHSFLRADALPLVPGQKTEARFGLFATSVLLRQGHRLRLALAGHDASVFQRYPAQGDPVLTVYHGSRLILPVRLSAERAG